MLTNQKAAKGFHRASLTEPSWNLTFNPDCTIGEELLFPDGNGLLQGVDDILTSFKSGFAMSGRDHDNNAGLADFQPPQAVHNTHAVHRPTASSACFNLLHLLERHRFVTLVLQVQRLPTLAVI